MAKNIANTASISWSGSNVGVSNPSYATDGNDSTASTGYKKGEYAYAKIEIILDFGRDILFTGFRAFSAMRTYYGDYGKTSRSESFLSIAVDGSTNYTTIFSTVPYVGDGEGYYPRDQSKTIETKGRYVKFLLTGTALNTNSSEVTIYLYELETYSNMFENSGIKAKTKDGIIILGKEPTLSSPLRYRKGGVTHSLGLVETTSLSASPIRIKTKDGIKAIAKY